MKIKDYLILMLLLIAAILLVIVSYPRKTTADNNFYLSLQVSNPYTLALELEVKCDWQPEKERYKYYRKVYIPRKSITSLVFPNHLKTCELWPKIDW